MSSTGIIKNRDQLATSKLRTAALEIIEAGISRVLPDTIMRTAVKFEKSTNRLHPHLNRLPSRERRRGGTLCVNGDALAIKGRLFVIGGGKAPGLMAETLEDLMGLEVIESGLVVEKADPREFETHKIRIVQAGHPIPDDRGVRAVEEMLALKRKYAFTGNDLILCLISGGGSALMPCPLEGISLEDKQKVAGLLLASGATITEINAVRKHLSRTKGGRLAQHFAPTPIISLILSDVIGNDPSVIASGPTFPDTSTFADAYAVLKKYDLCGKVPVKVISTLESGCGGEIAETPKGLTNACNYIIGDNLMALEAMADKARGLGFTPLIITAEQTGETTQAARQRAKEIVSGLYNGYDALLIGGETTPALPDKPGRGGRNQHYAAVTLEMLQNYPGEWLAASIGTDGSDYIPEVAGALVDGQTFRNISSRGLDLKAYLEAYDSYSLLNSAGGSLVYTGSTHTNVGDVMLYLFRK